jgi:hypothetical protein
MTKVSKKSQTNQSCKTGVSGSACTGASCCTIDCSQEECSHITFHICVLSGLTETKANNKIIGTYHKMRPWNWNGYHYPLIDKIKKHIMILKEKKLINEDLSITEVGFAFLADR